MYHQFIALDAQLTTGLQVFLCAQYTAAQTVGTGAAHAHGDKVHVDVAVSQAMHIAQTGYHLEIGRNLIVGLVVPVLVVDAAPHIE